MKLYWKIKLIGSVLYFLFGWCFVDIQGATNNASCQTEIPIHELVKQIEGISAMGYLPLWRVAMTHEGVEVGMSSLNNGIFKYHNITKTPEGWIIEAQNKGISIKVTVIKRATVCSLSKQWYPYTASIGVVVPGKPQIKYNGIAIKENQKPLAPHPALTDVKLLDGGFANEDIYCYIDRLKFQLMENDYESLSHYLLFPIRFNSTTENYLINDKETFLSKANHMFSDQVKQAIINCSYSDFYKKENETGVAGGILCIGVVNGQLTISSINKNN